MSDRPFQHLGGEELRRQLKRADRDLASEITRLRTHDPRFGEALDLALALETETEHRRSK